MPGIEAINATGSLKIAVIAPTIVFISLSLLAIIVSVLEKALRTYDQLMKSLTNLFRSKDEATPARPSTRQRPSTLTQEEKQAAHFLEMIIQRLGEPFTLSKLEAVAEERGIENCGKLIRHLVDLEAIRESDVPEEEGCYHWKGIGG